MNDTSRRQFLRGDFSGRDMPLRPPWALREREFAQRCTRCDACNDACPTGIIVRGQGGFPEVDFSRGPAGVLVYRPRFRVEVRRIGDAEASFLAAAQDGETLETALTAAHSHDVSFDLGRSLGEWIGSSVIVDFTLNGG